MMYVYTVQVASVANMTDVSCEQTVDNIHNIPGGAIGYRLAYQQVAFRRVY